MKNTSLANCLFVAFVVIVVDVLYGIRNSMYLGHHLAKIRRRIQVRVLVCGFNVVYSCLQLLFAVVV